MRVRAESRAIGGDIRVRTTNTVIQSLGCVDVNLELRVVRVGQVSLLEVLLHSVLLVRRLGEVIRESTRSAKVSRGTAEIDVHDALRILDGLVWVNHGAADGGYVWAVRWVLGVEDLLVWTEAAVGRTVSWEGSYTVVTRGEED